MISITSSSSSSSSSPKLHRSKAPNHHRYPPPPRRKNSSAADSHDGDDGSHRPLDDGSPSSPTSYKRADDDKPSGGGESDRRTRRRDDDDDDDGAIITPAATEDDGSNPTKDGSSSSSSSSSSAQPRPVVRLLGRCDRHPRTPLPEGATSCPYCRVEEVRRIRSNNVAREKEFAQILMDGLSGFASDDDDDDGGDDNTSPVVLDDEAPGSFRDSGPSARLPSSPPPPAIGIVAVCDSEKSTKESAEAAADSEDNDGASIECDGYSSRHDYDDGNEPGRGPNESAAAAGREDEGASIECNVDSSSYGQSKCGRSQNESLAAISESMGAFIERNVNSIFGKHNKTRHSQHENVAAVYSDEGKLIECNVKSSESSNNRKKPKHGQNESVMTASEDKAVSTECDVNSSSDEQNKPRHSRTESVAAASEDKRAFLIECNANSSSDKQSKRRHSQNESVAAIPENKVRFLTECNVNSSSDKQSKRRYSQNESVAATAVSRSKGTVSKSKGTSIECKTGHSQRAPPPRLCPAAPSRDPMLSADSMPFSMDFVPPPPPLAGVFKSKVTSIECKTGHSQRPPPPRLSPAAPSRDPMHSADSMPLSIDFVLPHPPLAGVSKSKGTVSKSKETSTECKSSRSQRPPPPRLFSAAPSQDPMHSAVSMPISMDFVPPPPPRCRPPPRPPPPRSQRSTPKKRNSNESLEIAPNVPRASDQLFSLFSTPWFGETDVSKTLDRLDDRDRACHWSDHVLLPQLRPPPARPQKAAKPIGDRKDHARPPPPPPPPPPRAPSDRKRKAKRLGTTSCPVPPRRPAARLDVEKDLLTASTMRDAEDDAGTETLLDLGYEMAPPRRPPPDRKKKKKRERHGDGDGHSWMLCEDFEQNLVGGTSSRHFMDDRDSFVYDAASSTLTGFDDEDGKNEAHGRKRHFRRNAYTAGLVLVVSAFLLLCVTFYVSGGKIDTPESSFRDEEGHDTSGISVAEAKNTSMQDTTTQNTASAGSTPKSLATFSGSDQTIMRRGKSYGIFFDVETALDSLPSSSLVITGMDLYLLVSAFPTHYEVWTKEGSWRESVIPSSSSSNPAEYLTGFRKVSEGTFAGNERGDDALPGDDFSAVGVSKFRNVEIGGGGTRRAFWIALSDDVLLFRGHDGETMAGAGRDDSFDVVQASSKELRVYYGAAVRAYPLELVDPRTDLWDNAGFLGRIWME